MKKIIASVCFTLLCIFLIAQKKITDSTNSKDLVKKISTVVCDRPPSSICNLVENKNFSSTCFGTNPFFDNCVDKWGSFHGSPQLNIFSPLISAGVNHASMWSTSTAYTSFPSEVNGEGIATGIPKLVPGNKYAFSIFKRYFSSDEYPTIDLDNFYIVLIKCADYLALRTQFPNIPSLPQNSQVIYCETDITNHSFQRIFQSFTANDSYDVVWIYPKQATFVLDVPKQSWLEVAKLEIININNFNAGSNPVTPIPPNCTITIGPNSPNCGLEGSVFTWLGPNGQSIIAPANQQIQVDASNSQNVGTWTLTMTVPNAVTTNNTCSDPGILQATVYVPLCTACPPNQTVSILNNATQLHPSTTSPYTIDFNKINVVCYPWEWGDRLKIQSSFPTGNTWYFNGTAIPQWVIGTGNGNEFLSLSNCMNNNMPGLCMNQIAPIEIRVSNPNSCNGISDPVNILFNRLYTTPTPEWNTFRPGNTTNIKLFDYGPGSGYTWHNNYPGVIITPLNSTWSNVDIYVPLSYAGQILNMTIDNINPWCNANINYSNSSAMCTNYCSPSFVMNLQVLTSMPILYGGNENANKVLLYPNPTANDVTFMSKDATISSIEISDLFGPSINKLKVTNLKTITINVTTLKTGTYNCKITTNKGVEYQKLIIKR